jgi:hypothetical protein
MRFQVVVPEVALVDTETGREYLVSAEVWDKTKQVAGIFASTDWMSVAKTARAIDPTMSLKTAWAIGHALTE